MNKKKEKIVAVVVTFNRKNLLEENINALLNQTYKLDDIYIIDNASTDGTKEYLKEKKLLDKITYFRLKENTGGAGGFNFGFEKAYKNFDWIWAMDDDAIPYKDALEKLVRNKYFEDEKVGALCCNAIYPEDLNFKISPTISAIIANDKMFGNNNILLENFKQNFVKITSYSLLGIIFRSGIINTIGNVNKEFFIECDDLDFTLRLSEKYNIVWVKESKLLHKISSSSYLSKKVLHKTLIYLDYSQSWKEYYLIRNYTYITREKHTLNIKSLIIGNLRQAIIIVIFLDKKILRLKMLFISVKDGLMGNLGKKYIPQDFINI